MNNNENVGILFADATDESGMPIPVKCQWFRVKNDRLYQIPDISSNVYQLSSEDVNCTI